MELILISGQPNTEQKMRDLFDKIRKDRHFLLSNLGHWNFLDFPERQPIHPKQLLEEIKETVKEHMEKDIPLIILTYSDHVFNAVRIVVKEKKFEGCEVHQIKETGEDIVEKIDTNGRMNVWVEDVFDVWDQALFEIV